MPRIRSLTMLPLVCVLATSGGTDAQDHIFPLGFSVPPGWTNFATAGFIDFEDLILVAQDHLVLGGATDSAGVTSARAWASPDGAVWAEEALPALATGKDAWANSAHRDVFGAASFAVGLATDALAMRRPALWRRPDGVAVSVGGAWGPCELLPALGGGEGEVTAIGDDSGDGNPDLAAGSSKTAGGVDKPVVWAGEYPGPYTVTALPDYGPMRPGNVVSILFLDGPFRFLAGWAADSTGAKPQVWKSADGMSWTRSALPLLPGGAQGRAAGLETGTGGVLFAVGWSEVAGGLRHAALWQSTDSAQTWSVTDLGTVNALPESEAAAVAMDLGDPLVVGTSYGAPGTEVAAAWSGPVLLAEDLNAKVVSANGLLLRQATGVSTDPYGSWLIAGAATMLPGARSIPGARAFVATEGVGVSAGPGPAAAGPLHLEVRPNPSAAVPTVWFSVPSPGPVRVSVHDIAGRRVATWVDARRSAGTYVSGGRGTLAPGVYFVRLVTQEGTATARFVRVR